MALAEKVFPSPREFGISLIGMESPFVRIYEERGSPDDFVSSTIKMGTILNRKRAIPLAHSTAQIGG